MSRSGFDARCAVTVSSRASKPLIGPWRSEGSPVSLNTACASGATGIQLAVEAIRRGGYVLADCDGPPQCLVIATGSEVQLALEAADGDTPHHEHGSHRARRLVVAKLEGVGAGLAVIELVFPEPISDASGDGFFIAFDIRYTV